jgi:hypothetical protein
MPVPDFSPGEILTASAMDQVGLWLVKTQTIGAGVTSVTVTDAFSANYDGYVIKIIGGVASAGTLINFRLGASATQYYSGGFVGNYGSAVLTAVNDNNTTAFTRAGVADTLAIHMDMRLDNPFATKISLFKADFVGPSTTSAGGLVSGIHNSAASYSAFTFFTNGGVTLTGGTVRVYGYRN